MAAGQPRFKAGILQEYFNVMLYRDLVERYEIADVSLLKYLLKRLIASCAKEFSVNKLYNDLKSRGFKIGKDVLYRLIEQIFSIYMVACVEKYDQSVVRRQMSNRKIFLYDNGLASAIHYAFAEDRGKLLENLVYAGLRRSTEDIYFLKNGYECDFAVFPRGEKPILIQVAEKVHPDNLAREVKGLEKARQRVSDGRCLLITIEAVPPSAKVPDWIETTTAVDWLLDRR